MMDTNQNEVYINPETGRPVRVPGGVYLFAGATGGGKTTLIRDMIKLLPLPKEIFDADGEYRLWTPQLDRYDEKREDILEDLAVDFKRRVAPLAERVIVFSEAGMFVRNRFMSFQVLEIIKSARRRGNFVFMDFHSISEINKDVLRVMDYLYIKKHGLESSEDLRKFSKYPSIIKALTEVQSSSNKFEYRIITRQNLEIKM